MTCATQPGSKGKVGFQFAGSRPRVTQNVCPSLMCLLKSQSIEKAHWRMAERPGCRDGRQAVPEHDFVNSVAANMVGNAIYTGYAGQEDLKDKIQFGAVDISHSNITDRETL